MSDPKRIQLKRTKGWRMPSNTVKVCRPGPWGNPFVVTEKVKPGAGTGGRYIAVPTAEDAVACYREMLTLPGERPEALRAALPELRGKNLACWCKLHVNGTPVPCHADVLISLANDIPLDEVIRENLRRAKGEEAQ